MLNQCFQFLKVLVVVLTNVLNPMYKSKLYNRKKHNNVSLIRPHVVLCFLLLFALIFSFNGLLIAQSTRWNGSQSSDWFDAGNWDNGVPGPGDEASITWKHSGNQWPVIDGVVNIRKLVMGPNSNELTVVSGSMLNISEDASISNTATLKLLGGSVIVNSASTLGGNLIIDQGGSFTINAPFIVSGSPNLNLIDGNVIINGDYEMLSGTFIVEEGSVSFNGDTSIRGDGLFHAGSAELLFNGNIELSGSAIFNPQSSSALITGTSAITVLSNIDQTTIFFYDLVVTEGASINADANVLVYNDMTVENEASFAIINDYKLNVVGKVSGDANINTNQPYIISLFVIDETTVLAVFNAPLNPSTAENTTNYHVKDALFGGSNIGSVASASLGGDNDNEVTLALNLISPGIIEAGEEYFLVANNIQNTTGGTISSNHYKRFGAFAGGEGSQENPYIITNLYELQAVQLDPNANYILGNDIDATASVNMNGGLGFDPIRDFSGRIDGQGFTIYGLTINRPNEDNVGLFGSTKSGASINDFILDDILVNGKNNTGGLIGVVDGETEIIGILVEGNITGGSNTGGLIGKTNGSLELQRSASRGTITGGDKTGGLIGETNSRVVIRNAYSRANITGGARVGGLVGDVSGTGNQRTLSLYSSYATGPVTAQGQSGGLVGFLAGQYTINNSYWDTKLSGQNNGSHQDQYAQGRLVTEQMIGEAALENMSGFDFDDVWAIMTDPPSYPELFDFFTVVIGKIYYSIQDGDWSDKNTWSVESHTSQTPAIRPPIPIDQMLIGNGHHVTLDKNAINNNSVTVYDEGTLITGDFILSGTGVFTLDGGATLQIGSADGITTIAASGSIQTLGRSFSNQANYVYNGESAQQTGNGLPDVVNDLQIDNNFGVTALRDQTVTGELILTSGILTMPEGSSLVTFSVAESGNGQVKMQNEITGSKGWRMVASPVETSYGDLFNNFVTQGYTGSDFEHRQPNILWFDEGQVGTTNMAWRKPDSNDAIIPAGRGHFQYIFNGAGWPDYIPPEEDSDPPPEEDSYTDSLPITMTSTGREYMTGNSFIFDVSYTERPPQNSIPEIDVIEMNAGWNLIGNPTTASLDWESDGWTRSNVDAAYYVWVPSAGEFQAWNSTIEDIEDPDYVAPLSGDGLIAPFQAFWVRAHAESPVLSFDNTVKVTGGSFEQKSFPAHTGNYEHNSIPLALRLEADGLKTFSYITFTDRGDVGEDPYDAYHLEPMSDTWLKLITTTNDHHLPMVINNLPKDFGEILHIPVYVEGQRDNHPVTGDYSLSWSIPHSWPLNWQLTLMDHEKKEAIRMTPFQNKLDFKVYQSRQAPANVPGGNPLVLPKQIIGSTFESPLDRNKNKTLWGMSGNGEYVGAKTTGVSIPARFSIMITTGEYEGELDYVALEPSLLPVFPNPATNHSPVTIRFSLPDKDKVSISIYDLHGRQVYAIPEKQYGAGIHRVGWTPGSLNSGVYFVVLLTESARNTQKIIMR